MIIIPFEPEHVSMLDVQSSQTTEVEDQAYYRMLRDVGEAVTFYDVESCTVVACVGQVPHHGARIEVWALLSSHAKRFLYSITKYLLHRLEELEYNRADLTVRGDFEEAHKWAKMLGFYCDTPNGMECYYNNTKYYLYARLKCRA